jgi:Uma2 family endonuclease
VSDRLLRRKSGDWATIKCVIAEKAIDRNRFRCESNHLAMARQLRYSACEFMSIEVSKKLFTVHEYHRMVDAGIFRENDCVELIRGEIIAMSPISPPHNAAILRANQALGRIVGDRALVGVQGSIRLDEYDEPQPDLYLLRPKDDFYASGHAGPADILLIIEVADSSLKYDQGVKPELYAETGVPEYWISNLQDDLLIVHLDPQGKTYRTVRQIHRGHTIAPQLLPDCPVLIDSLLA